jgi:hypothetical protein
MSRSVHETFPPRPALKAELGEFARLAEEACGLHVESLKVGQTLLIQTHYSTYSVSITNPRRAQGIATGDGSFLTEPTPVTIVGSSLSGRGSAVATGRVLTGFRLVIACPEGEIVTSKVRGISVDGMPAFDEFLEA